MFSLLFICRITNRHIRSMTIHNSADKKKKSHQTLNYESAIFPHKKSAELQVVMLLNAADL